MGITPEGEILYPWRPGPFTPDKYPRGILVNNDLLPGNYTFMMKNTYSPKMFKAQYDGTKQGLQVTAARAGNLGTYLCALGNPKDGGVVITYEHWANLRNQSSYIGWRKTSPGWFPGSPMAMMSLATNAAPIEFRDYAVAPKLEQKCEKILPVKEPLSCSKCQDCAKCNKCVGCFVPASPKASPKK